MEQQLYWVEDVNGTPHFCLFLKKVTYKEIATKWSVDYNIQVPKLNKSENVVYKESFAPENLPRLYLLIKQLPLEAIPGAVELYKATKAKLQEAHVVAEAV